MSRGSINDVNLGGVLCVCNHISFLERSKNDVTHVTRVCVYVLVVIILGGVCIIQCLTDRSQ